MVAHYLKGIERLFFQIHEDYLLDNDLTAIEKERIKGAVALRD